VIEIDPEVTKASQKYLGISPTSKISDVQRRWPVVCDEPPRRWTIWFYLRGRLQRPIHSLSSHHKRIRNAVEEAFEKGWTPSDECDRSFRERILPALLYSDLEEVFGKGMSNSLHLDHFKTVGGRERMSWPAAKTGYWRLGQKLEQDRREWSNLLYDDSRTITALPESVFSGDPHDDYVPVDNLTAPTSDNWRFLNGDESIGRSDLLPHKKMLPEGSLKRRGWGDGLSMFLKFLLHGFS